MGLRSTDDREETCMNCVYAKPAGYRQIICKKNNEWHSELYSCRRFIHVNQSVDTGAKSKEA